MSHKPFHVLMQLIFSFQAQQARLRKSDVRDQRSFAVDVFECVVHTKTCSDILQQGDSYMMPSGTDIS
jgi:hypothetical protein